MENKPRIRLTKDGGVLHEVRCSVCKKCWLREGAMNCIYGGPFDGYEKDTTEGKKDG